METQALAIRGDVEAIDMIARVAAIVGANPCENDRLGAWQRLLKEDAKALEGAAQPTKRKKNAHMRSWVQGNLLGAPVSDQVLLEQFAGLTLEHKRTLEDAIADGEVSRRQPVSGEEEFEDDELNKKAEADTNDENDLERQLSQEIEWHLENELRDNVAAEKRGAFGDLFDTAFGVPQSSSPSPAEAAASSSGAAGAAASSSGAAGAAATAPAGEIVTLVKYKQKLLVQVPVAMQTKLAVPGARHSIMSRFTGCDSVRGQTYRFVQVKFSAQPSEPLARALFVAACGTEHNDATVCLMPDEALVLFRVGRRESRETFTPTQDLKFLLGDTVGIKHMTFADKSNYNQQLLETVELLFSAAEVFVGTLRVQDEMSNSADDGILTMEEAMDALQRVRIAEYKVMCGDAKRAKFLKKTTPLQQALITMRFELDDYMRAKEQTSMILEFASGVEFRLPGDFNPKVCELLKGHYWHVASQKIQTLTLGEWLNTTEHKLRSLFLVGGSEAGKSSLLRALARIFSVRTGLGVYAFFKKLDPAGLLTRSGEINTCSSFIFTDFEMNSLKDDKLDEESVKALIDVAEPGGYPARYHVALFPKNKPRMFAVNAGLEDGAIDYGWWFAKQPFCYPLALLARKNEEDLAKCTDAQQAIARRTIIFNIEDRDHIGLRVQNGQQSLQRELEVELQREKEHADHDEEAQS